MALTFLDLTNKTLRRLNEVELTSSTFASAKGFHAQVKDAVNSAILEINSSEREWPFNFSSASITLTPNSTAAIAIATNATSIDWGSFFIPANVSFNNQAMYVAPITLDDWRQNFRPFDQSLATVAGLPKCVAPTQDLKFVLSPAPDQAYTLMYDFWQTPTDLVNYNDTTAIYDRYWPVIVNGAMYHAYMFRENFESAAVIKKEFKAGIEKMRTELINPTNQDFQIRDTRTKP